MQDAHVSSSVMETLMYMYHVTCVMPLCVAEYVCALYAGGMNGDSIITLIENSRGSNFIFSPRHFFHELGPLVKYFDFSPDRIAHNIAEFDQDMVEYSTELVGRRYVNDKFNNPSIKSDDVEKLISACAAPRGKYWRAAVDFMSWFKLVPTADSDALNILNRCVTATGVNMQRLMQITTGRLGTLSRTDGGQTIRPRINLAYIRYANVVHKFFAKNAEQIRAATLQYKNSDIDFMNAFYEICVTWPHWPFTVSHIELSTPTIHAKPYEIVRYVMIAITRDLPANVAEVILDISEYDFTRIMPRIEHESAYAKMARYDCDRSK
ncbi:MAG: hypothetical protein J6T57_04625 [Alphaproteobacteria bacterium]|nr:hypothetical protein [Alphaproteobacteria bacterium]